MPELLTKHPEVAIQVLVGGGARCGPGQEQAILKQCRPERFCSTRTGEVCVFGLDELSSMTQIKKAELAELVCEAKQQTSSACALVPLPPSQVPGFAVTLAFGVLGVLAVARRVGARFRARGSRSRSASVRASPS